MHPVPPQQRPARLAVGVIGAGRVGAVLGAALSRAGHEVVAVSAVSEASLDRAETFVPGAAVVDPTAVAGRAELLLLAVPDDVLPGLVRGLVAADTVRPGTFVVHVSGAHGLEVLAPLIDLGALPLALHPAMSFTGTEVDLQRLDGTSFGITSPPELRPVAEALVIEMSGDPVWIDPADRGLYHAALALGANTISTLVCESADLLRQAGVEAPQRMLGPLLGAAVDNALRRGDAALTGPAVRGDVGTVTLHLDRLATHDRRALAPYVEVSRLTVERAERAGRLDPAAASAVLEVLTGGRQ